MRPIAIILLMLLAPLPITALPRGGPAPGAAGSRIARDKLIDNWSTEEGLPESSVICMAQTLDGYLWLGTFAGLVRFDGVRFKIFDAGNTQELPNSRIVNLHADRNGRLWIRSEAGDLTLLENGRFKRLTPRDGFPESGGVRVPTETQNGEVWVPTANIGMLRFENGRLVPRVPDSPALKRGYQSLLATSDGQIFGTGGNILTRLWPGEIVDYVFDPNRPEALVKSSEIAPERALQIQFLEQSRDGGIWVAAEDGLRKYRDGRWREFRPSSGPLKGVANLYEDRPGNVWLGTWDDGARQFEPNGKVHRLTLTDSPVHEPVRSFLEDREGNLWIGTLGAGLFRVKPRVFHTYGVKDGLAAKLVSSVSQSPDGTLWILNSEQVHRLREENPPVIERLKTDFNWRWCNLAARDGTVWLATLRSGLFRFRDGAWTQYPFDRTLQMLFEDHHGAIWTGGDRALARVEGNALRDIPLPPGLENFQITAMADDGADGLYVGSNGGGLFRYAKGQWTRFSRAEGLSDERIWSLFGDREGTIWVGGYDRGLSRLKEGRIFTYANPALRLPSMVGSILEDDRGYLWFGSNRGIYSAARADLNAYAEGRTNALHVLLFGKQDGLETPECATGAQPVACKGRDGKLWFATTAGVAVVDPSTLARNSVAPLMAIEEVVVDEVEARKENDSVTVPPGKHRIEIRFTALTLSSPEKSRFSYQMEGFDPEWVDAGGRRSAYFTAVQPGKYRFHVKGANNDGVWSQSDAVLAVIVLPYYWQTGWFRAGAIALVSGLGALGYHRRIATLKREQSAQAEFSRRLIQSQEQERKRISAELHDGLGQSLLMIRQRAVLGRDAAGSAAEAPAQFEAISEAALHAINEVRAIAYDLRPYELDRLGLTKALEAIAQRASAAVGFQTELDLDLIDDLLPPEFEINLYRIVQEAVSNAVKYAGARNLKLKLKAQAHALLLTIQDDGRGFVLAGGLPEPSAKGGLGLGGLLERAKIMGGEAVIESAPGQGTVLKVIIPLPNRERS